MRVEHIRFYVLVSIVAISGLSQGMLLPTIAVLFEQDGLSSSLNGIHATGLYIGVLLASPFMEQPLRKLGYRPIILIGGFVVMVSLALFSVWESFWFWFLLRLFIGIGDHMLHFGTQTWITTFSPEHKRGKNISLYGLFFGLGFAVGPMLTSLISIHTSLPFIISSLISLLAWLTLFLLKNEYPEEGFETSSIKGTINRFGSAWKYAWVAFLPPLGYGFLETSISGNFPVYGLRMGLDVTSVSIILPAFAIGGIVFQLPLGILSDRVGRRNILIASMFLGFISFFIAGFLTNPIHLLLCFFVAGMGVGSTFSLGISYMTDLLPKSLLPAGNLMCGIFFSIGSISGPFIGGIFIELYEESFFFVISTILLLILLAISTFKEPALLSEK